jgi:hypothetical protein
MTGTSNQEVDQVNLSMDVLLGQWVPILDEAVCGTSIECPVQASSEWSMKYTYEVDNRLPDGETNTRWKLVGNSGSDEVACAYIQLEVV